jgi:hypothetical protein
MIIVVAIIGTVYGEAAASGEIFAWIEDLLGSQAAAAVEDAVARSRPSEAGLLPTLLGIGALLFGATTVFAQMQSSLNQFWDVRPKPERSGMVSFVTVRLLSLGMVLILGFLMLISFAVTIAITGMIEYAGHWIAVPSVLVSAVDVALSLLVTTRCSACSSGSCRMCSAAVERRVARRPVHRDSVRGRAIPDHVLPDAGGARIHLRRGRSARPGAPLGVFLVAHSLLRHRNDEGCDPAPRRRRRAQGVTAVRKRTSDGPASM